MAITKEFFEAKERFVEEYLIEKPKLYKVDFSLFSALTLAPQETTWAANTIGVGIGEKYRKGLFTGQTALRVYVVEKFSEGIVKSMPPELRVPSTYGRNIPTDVIAVGRPVLRQVSVTIEGININYIRAVPGGYSIGNVNEASAGTLGCMVRDRDDPSKLYILSNNHVIARQNSASSGEEIVQPGPFDGGVRPAIAVYEQHNDMVHTDSISNTVDAALGKVIDRNLVSPEISEIGRIKGIMRATEKRWALKCGRTTGLSRGYIDDVNVTLKIPFAGGIALFADQMLILGVPSLSVLSAPTAGLITPFSAPGDSGSLIVDEAASYAVGLLFAGSDRYNITYANKIENVLHQLDVELVT